jgi:ankyrin repeat protein
LLIKGPLFMRMLTTTPNLGFSEGFYHQSTANPSIGEAENSTSLGAVFNPDLHSSFEAFKKSETFAQAKKEFIGKTTDLIQFAREYCEHDRAAAIATHLEAFKAHIENPEYFKASEDQIYSYAKERFDQFFAQMQNDKIPLTARTNELDKLAYHLEKCGPATIYALEKAASALNFTDDGVHKQASQAHEELVHAVLQEFVRQRLLDEHTPGMEVHYVAEIKRCLGFPDAVGLPSDPFVNTQKLTDQIVEQAYQAIRAKAGPSQVALLMAERCLQDLRDKFPGPLEFSELNAALEKLAKQFGPITHDAVVNCSEQTGELSLMASPNLLARGLLGSLAGLGATIQPPVQVLGWRPESNQTRVITVQDEYIAYIEQKTAGNDKAKALTEYACVTKQDLERLYQEVHLQKTNPVNGKTLSALLLTVIDTAEPGELASFEPSWLCHDKAVLDSFIRKCAPETLSSWVRNQTDSCTAEQKLQILEALSDQGKVEAFSDVLKSITPSDLTHFLSKCNFAERIDQVIRNNNVPLLGQWFNLLNKIPAENQAAVWLGTSETLAHILKTGSSLQAHAEYFHALEQAKNNQIVSQSEIKFILEAKDSNGTPGLYYALQEGHTDTVKAFLEALPGLKEFELTADQIKDILEAKNQNGTPGLYMALQEGRADTVKAFLEALPGLKEFELTADQIKDIVEARWKGTPGLHMALQNGHADTVKAFLEALPGLKEFELTADQIKDILEAKRDDGVPGLAMVLFNGHGQAVKAFLEALPGLKEFELTADQIKDIVEARTSDGVLGLTVVREQKHQQTEEVYLANLRKLGLDDKWINALKKNASSSCSIQ